MWLTVARQSAGGLSVDIYSYAWVEDPIVNAFIPHSGAISSSSAGILQPNNNAAWFNTSVALDCGDASAGLQASISCVRTKPFQALLDATRPENALAGVAGSFSPTIDGKVIFADAAQRLEDGNFIKRPYFIGTTNYEAGLFKLVASASNITTPEIVWDLLNLIAFNCPARSAAQARADAGVPVWRYRYFGEFPNTRLSINPPSGAWHGSELPIVWGTSAYASGRPNTAAETSISNYMRGAWAAFAKDPESAFTRAPYSFPRYSSRSESSSLASLSCVCVCVCVCVCMYSY